MSLITRSTWISFSNFVLKRHPKKVFALGLSSKFADYDAFLSAWENDEVSDQQETFVNNEISAFMKRKPYATFTESPLQQLVRLLREDDGDQPSAPREETGDSLDAQVDRYLSDYEASSKKAKHEGTDFRRTVRRLLEAGGDDDTGSDDAGETETTPAPEPSKPTLDDIDIEEFANNVARLIQNYDNLLEVHDTLIKRSMNFVSKNYSPDVASAFERALRDRHGLVDGESKQDVDDDLYAAPSADRAGPGGAGA